jgi:signal transduction histidine kinase
VFTVGDTAFDRWRTARSLVFLVLLTVGMVTADPGPAPSGQGLVVLVGVVVAGAAWVAMALRPGGDRALPAWLGICGAAGLVLTAVAPSGLAPCYLLAAGVVAAGRLPLRTTLVVAATQVVGLATVLTLRHSSVASILAWTGAQLVVLLVGVVRRQRGDQERQARELAAMGERARLAREIHDVLAHSLSALSVQLETAAALLERDRAGEAAVVVDRAGRLARDGLTETRRAVSALRGDPLPVPELIGALLDGYRADLDAPASLTVSGVQRPLDPEAGLALYRSAQEALTNVRRHAPGSKVEVTLAYDDGSVRLTVRNQGPSYADRRPAPGLSSGYGLTGLRERAELVGGSVHAGPDGDGWLVDVRLDDVMMAG